MTLPLSTKTLVRFTPPGLDGEPGAPVYLLQVPTLRDKAAWRREVIAAGVVYHDATSLRRGLKAGIAALFDAEQARELIDLLDRFDEARDAFLEDVRRLQSVMKGKPATVADAAPGDSAKGDAAPDPEPAADPGPAADPEPVKDEAYQASLKTFNRLAQQVNDLDQAVRAQHPPYLRLFAENLHYDDMAPLVALEMFLKGWENVDGVFRRANGKVSDETILCIPADQRTQVGQKIISLFGVTDAQSKN